MLKRKGKKAGGGGVNKPIISLNLGNKQNSKLLFCAVFLTQRVKEMKQRSHSGHKEWHLLLSVRALRAES